MGWISQRCARTGTCIGGTKGMKFGDMPLRKIVYTVHFAEGMFDRDTVILECGHQVMASGQYRARCWKCRDGKPVDEPGYRTIKEEKQP